MHLVKEYSEEMTCMIFIQNMICTWVFACLKMHVMGIFDPALKNINEFFTIDIDDWVGKDTPS